MAHVVTEACVGCLHMDCVVGCPMECFYGDDVQLYIDPIDCIDCGACINECPVNAIERDDLLPSEHQAAIALNARRSRELKLLGKRVTEKR
jgi:ferredoxin